MAPKPSLPASIQIGPLVYDVTETQADYHKAAAEQEAALWGHISFGKCVITLSPDQAVGHKRLSLLHEVLHGVWHLHDGTHDSDEEVLRSMTADLLDTLRRNPGLLAYLTAP